MMRMKSVEPAFVCELVPAVPRIMHGSLQNRYRLAYSTLQEERQGERPDLRKGDSNVIL